MAGFKLYCNYSVFADFNLKHHSNTFWSKSVEKQTLGTDTATRIAFQLLKSNAGVCMRPVQNSLDNHVIDYIMHEYAWTDWMDVY